MEILIVFINQRALLQTFFPLAALIKSLPKTKINMVPVDASWLGNQENVLGVIEEIKESLGPEARFSYPIFHLLGIGPSNEEESMALLKFAAYNDARIKSWIGAGFGDILIEDLRSLGTPFTLQKEDESLLEALKRSGINVWDYLRKADELWRSNETEAIWANEYAGRYLKVFHVLDVMLRNCGDDDLMVGLNHSLMELTSGRRDPYVSSLVSTWERMEKFTQTACKKMNDRNPLFRRAKQMGRPVGYVDLGEAPDYVDYQSILDCAAKKFPHLAVVKYSIGPETYIRAHSEIFEISIPTWDRDENQLRAISRMVLSMQTAYN